MLDHLNLLLDYNQDLIITALISVIFAFLIWSVKDSYQRYCNEIALLGKIEIIFAHNLGSLLTNKSFFEEWIKALKKPLLYNCAFRSYTFFDNEDYSISNAKLLNKLIAYDFCLRGLQADTSLFFDGYHNSSLMLLPQNLVKEWEHLNKNTLDQSSVYESNFDHAIEDAKEIIGLIRAYAKQKRNTPYGWARFIIGRNLLPEIKKETIDKYKAEIDNELIQKNQSLNPS